MDGAGQFQSREAVSGSRPTPSSLQSGKAPTTSISIPPGCRSPATAASSWTGRHDARAGPRSMPGATPCGGRRRSSRPVPTGGTPRRKSAGRWVSSRGRCRSSRPGCLRMRSMRSRWHAARREPQRKGASLALAQRAGYDLVEQTMTPAVATAEGPAVSAVLDVLRQVRGGVPEPREYYVPHSPVRPQACTVCVPGRGRVTECGSEAVPDCPDAADPPCGRPVQRMRQLCDVLRS